MKTQPAATRKAGERLEEPETGRACTAGLFHEQYRQNGGHAEAYCTHEGDVIRRDAAEVVEAKLDGEEDGEDTDQEDCGRPDPDIERERESGEGAVNGGPSERPSPLSTTSS